jgi:hypothetical protein
MSKPRRHQRSANNHRDRRLSVRAVRRDPVELRKFSRALILLAMAQAQVEADAEAEATAPSPSGIGILRAVAADDNASSSTTSDTGSAE